MSLEVTLIPLALVVINVIDKDYYDSWMKKSRLKMSTDYCSLQEFLGDLNQLDYEYEVKHDSVRICSGEKGKYFYFTKMQGAWNLSFSEYDSKSTITTFLSALSKISDGKVTESPPQDWFSKTKGSIKRVECHSIPAFLNKSVNFYPTIFKDFSLLCETLNAMGILYKIDGKNIDFQISGNKCSFLLDGEQYVLRTVGKVSGEDIFQSLYELDVVYKRNVQLATYESVMSKLTEKNMSLAKEARLEDGTIVLTLNVE